VFLSGSPYKDILIDNLKVKKNKPIVNIFKPCSNNMAGLMSIFNRPRKTVPPGMAVRSFLKVLI